MARPPAGVALPRATGMSGASCHRDAGASRVSGRGLSLLCAGPGSGRGGEGEGSSTQSFIDLLYFFS